MFGMERQCFSSSDMISDEQGLGIIVCLLYIFII